MADATTRSSSAIPSRRGPLRRLALGLALVAGLLVLVAAALVAGGAWLLTSEAGTRWLLARLPGVQASGVAGALLGPQWRIARLHVPWGDGRQWVTIDELAVDGLQWRWRPDDTVWVGVRIQALRARRVAVETGPPGPRPLPTPAHLAWPVRAEVAAAEVGELAFEQLEPLADLRVRGLSFDGRPGREHAIEYAAARGFGLRAELRAAIGNVAPLTLAGMATVRPAQGADDAPPWAAVLRIAGPLPAFDLQATLRGVPQVPAGARGAGIAGEAPSLDLQTQVRPLEAWPVRRLVARTEALDLAALVAAAPETRLSGDVVVQSDARDAPLQVRAQLVNRLPGRWDERRAPLARVDVDLRGEIARPDRVEATKLDLQFADGGGAAGRLQGRALWQGTSFTLDARIADLMPQRLDGRAPAMSLSGPVAFTVRGLPDPAGLTGAGPASAAASSAPGPAVRRPSGRRASGPWHVDARVQLDGLIEGAPRAVHFAAEGSVRPDAIELRSLQARAGNAQATMRATLARVAGGDWTLDTDGSLADFDPVPWWPGDLRSAWRRGPHRLNTWWRFAVRVPAAAPQMALPALAQSLAGNGRLQVRDSTLAGVALTADVTLSYAQAALPGSVPATLQAEIALGGNRIVVDGRGDPAGAGAADRWRVDIDAGRLAALAPLGTLDAGLAAWLPRQGSVEATIAAEGRWPGLATRGQARIEQLQTGPLALQRGQARWQLDFGERAGGASPLALQIEAGDVRWGGSQAERLTVELSGTVAEHRIEFAGIAPLDPPERAARLLALSTGGGTRVRLLARGRWLPEADGGRWQAEIGELSAGAAGADVRGRPWAEGRDLRGEARFDARGKLLGVRADAGRVRVADTLALHWDAVRIDLGAGRTDFEFGADVESFAVAPLLARLQPEMGWQGDLRLGARVAVRAGERFELDAAFERRGGDLYLESGDGLQLLGLTELRLALQARDGEWNFEPVLSGRSLGDIRGRLRVQATPQQRWPEADAPVEGAVQARVADLGIWGHWVPPGWRLTGEVRTTATVGGRFGAPTYTGEVSGRGIGVRNLLQGVSVADGEMLIRLAGETAEIERFTLRGGDGRITVSGGAAFGAQPSARLRLQAERFRVLGRVDRLVTASGEAELALAADASRLDGRLRIDEGLFDFSRRDAPSLDEDVRVLGEREAESPEVPAPRQRRNFTLAVDVDMGENLHVRGRGLDADLRGQVRITNPAGRLAIHGTIRTEQGTYAAYGQKLEIERGILAFSGPAEDPRLDVLAIRPNLDIRVGVQVSGTLQALRVRLYSDPELGQTDKLSWLVLGRPSDGLGRNDSAVLQRAAVALLAGEGEGPTDALLRTLGIDELSVRQSDADVRETVVTLGKQLSRRWYLGYERGVNATTGTWQLIYRVAQRVTVRMQSGLDNSLDVIWTWRFQEPPAEGGVRKSLPALPP